jgi:hypothetical protein
MSNTITFRVDRETVRILRDLTRRGKISKSRAIRDALRAQWQSTAPARQPSAWEIYSQLKIPKVKPYRDTASQVEELLKEKLLAKQGDGTL